MRHFQPIPPNLRVTGIYLHTFPYTNSNLAHNILFHFLLLSKYIYWFSRLLLFLRCLFTVHTFLLLFTAHNSDAEENGHEDDNEDTTMITNEVIL